MNKIITLLVLIQSISSLNALVINEVMSNPVGDDSGREWVEIYNDTESDVDMATLTISIKGGSFIPVTPVSGATIIKARGYGIIGSTVSGTTKFMQDYSIYSGPLFRSSISLVNTGVTSIELKLQGTIVDTLASYTPAKEGSTYSLIQGIFVTGTPTPGEENKTPSTEEETPSTVTQTGSQSLIAQASPPMADITLYLPADKIVVAGAPALFSVFSTTRAGKMIDAMTYTWAFGDGGQGSGSTTLYRYLYPGRYVAQVEGTNGAIAGTGRMMVRVVSPDITLTPVRVGKYGSYIDIINQNNYDLDISLWKITLDGVPFSFPKNTLLIPGVTRFPGSALGFASTTISSSTVIKLLLQNMDEVTRIFQGPPFSDISIQHGMASTSRLSKVLQKKQSKISPSEIHRLASTTSYVTTNTVLKSNKKDIRLASFIKSFFGE